MQFASDNYAGICPEALKAIERANYGHEPSYGEDYWTKKACDKFREVFEANCEVFFVFTGTAANGLALSSLCQSYHSVICHEAAHIETDECGAPEFFSHGSKLLLAKGENGKILPDELSRIINKRTDIHYPKPKVVSITQATELGTVYKLKELNEIHKEAKKLKLNTHMDGARLANAIASLSCKPAQITKDVGIDVLCFGGPKNGLALGEAVIFFNLKYAEDFAYRCKQAGQLASKMRFIAAQWFSVLENNIWLKYATHANECAALLEAELKRIDEIKILYPREANSVFIDIPSEMAKFLKSKGWQFYNFIGTGGIRLMCSWDMTKETIRDFVSDIKNFLKKYKNRRNFL
ncbi:MAG TPA: low specificity L-threonine aldolase [Victivallales bacterium]|nr:low specificity L-threonine aldolase [Victivallales bacterium]HRR27743.1 low specificity L-threonine aldolase [Victivallales bacterium]